MGEVEVVNIVGTGKLDAEFSLDQLALDLDSTGRYEPELYPGMYVRVDEDDPLTTVYGTGKFIIVGSSTEEELHSTKEKVIGLLSDTVGRELREVEFAINNYVCSGNLGRELKLDTLSIGLGLERAEYEPEQFPGLIYTPEGHDAKVMVFRTGNVTIAGGTSKEEAEQAFFHLKDRLDRLLSEEV